MNRDPRITLPSMKILHALYPDKRMSGLALSLATGIPTGTLFPILGRFHGAGWLERDWEAGDPRALGRPLRRYYHMSDTGQNKVRKMLELLAI